MALHYRKRSIIFFYYLKFLSSESYYLEQADHLLDELDLSEVMQLLHPEQFEEVKAELVEKNHLLLLRKERRGGSLIIKPL
jgi:hypothetical protein